VNLSLHRTVALCIGCILLWQPSYAMPQIQSTLEKREGDAESEIEQGTLDADWQPLFNGIDLTGWRLVNTPEDTWSFQDGVLRCTGKPTGEIRTEKMYQNFELEIEWRHLVPAGNAGIFVWADDITARGVPFHRSIEVQVLENDYGNTDSHTTHGDIFPIHGAELTPINGRGGSRAFPTEMRSKPSPEWNHYRIVCQDGSISLAVNGQVVTRGVDASPRKGYVCLESEGGVVEYRNGRIRELPDTPIDPKHIAIADRGFRSIYSGLDLRGWDVSDQAVAHWQASDWILRYDGRVPEEYATISMHLEEAIGGLIIDFRFSDGSNGLQLQLPGSESVVEISKAQTSPFAEHLQASKGWNRLEGSMEENGLVWRINGTALKAEQSLASGVLAITPMGPVELANLYIRPAN
jgi:hypothetical protein